MQNLFGDLPPVLHQQVQQHVLLQARHAEPHVGVQEEAPPIRRSGWIQIVYARIRIHMSLFTTFYFEFGYEYEYYRIRIQNRYFEFGFAFEYLLDL
jgi:hypothetical protein